MSVMTPALALPAAHDQFTQGTLCEACGTRFVPPSPCRFSSGDCSLYDGDRWNALCNSQDQLRYGSNSMLFDVLDHSFAGMF